MKRYVIKANVQPPAYLSAAELPWQTDRNEATVFNGEQAKIVLYIVRKWQLWSFEQLRERFELEPVSEPRYYVRHATPESSPLYANPNAANLADDENFWFPKDKRVPLLDKASALQLLDYVRSQLWVNDRKYVRLVRVG